MQPKSAGVSSHSRVTLPSSSSSCAMTRISPVSTSISTSASSAASGMRLYAVTNALASASSITSSEIPFSAASAESASSISGLRTGPTSLLRLLAARRPPGESGARLRDVVHCDLLDRAVVGLDAAAISIDADQGAVHPTRRAVGADLDRDLFADRAAEVLGTAERAFDARAAHLEHVRAGDRVGLVDDR